MAARNHIKSKQLTRALLCLLCFFVALSFIAPLLPIAVASSDTMPCCAGKAGHCDSGITPKLVLPPTSEPMCGLQAATMDDDGITIVATPKRTESHHSRSQNAETGSPAVASITKPCPMDCGACAAGSLRQQRRERGVLQSITHQNSSLITSSKGKILSVPFSTTQYSKQTSPRGPPSNLR